MKELAIAMQLSTACLRVRNDRLERRIARAVPPKRLEPANVLDRYEALIRRLKADKEVR